MKTDNMIDLDVEYLTHTSKAVCVMCDGEEMWFPDSQISDDSDIHVGCDFERGEEGVITVSEWIAKQKGLI
jgi:hypothetical protein